MLNNHLVVAHRVLVKFLQAATVADRSELKRAFSANDLTPVGSQGWYKLDVPGQTTATLLAAVPSIDTVARVVPDSVSHVVGAMARRLRARGPCPAETPDDTFFCLQWALTNTGQTIVGNETTTGTAGDDISAEQAWSYTTGSGNITDADFDTGMENTVADLTANAWSAPAAFSVTVGGATYNCPAGTHEFGVVSGDLGCTFQDDNGHGTFTAGVIGAAGNNNVGTTGVNWTSSLLAIQVAD